MPKNIICVYQDCPMCGSKGQKLKDLAARGGITVRKVSFASPEGKDLIYEALTNHKIGTMPFFTDGEKYSTNLLDFTEPVELGIRTRYAQPFVEKCEQKAEKSKKKVNRTKKCSHKKKGGEDESN